VVTKIGFLDKIDNSMIDDAFKHRGKGRSMQYMVSAIFVVLSAHVLQKNLTFNYSLAT